MCDRAVTGEWGGVPESEPRCTLGVLQAVDNLAHALKYHCCAAGALLVSNLLVASLLGVAAFSSFWAILETFQQQERVHKGWFPRNPRRRYPWDDAATGDQEPR